MKDSYVSVEHLLLRAGRCEGSASGAGRVLKQARGHPGVDPVRAHRGIRGNQRVTSAMPEAAYEALEKYGRDLVADARAGRLDPVIGRDAEIRRVIQILSRSRRTTRCSSATPGSARPPSSRAWLSGSSGPTCRKGCATRRSSRWTWARWWPGRSTAASSRSGSRRCWPRWPPPRAGSCCSWMSCTPWSEPARPRVRWTRATCSSRCWPGASCT